MTLRTEIDHLLPALEQAYESLGEAVNIVDSEDRLVFVNSTWLSLYGRSKEEISDKSLASIFLGDQVVVNDEMVRDAPGEKWVGEVERTRKNGEPFTAHLTVTFLKGRKGERLGRIAVVRDLTKAKRSEDAIRSLAKEQTVLAELGQIISSSLDTGDVFDHFADRVSSLIKYDRISIVIADDDEGIAYTTYCSGISIPEWEPGIVHPLKGTAAEAILRSGIPILANGDSIRSLVKDFPPLLPALEKSGLQSRLSVPLISNGRPVGVLTLNSLEFDAFSDHELTLMSQVGAQIAGTIYNAQLHSSLQRYAKERQALDQLGQSLNSANDLDDVFERFSEHVSHLITFDRFNINFINKEADSFGTAFVSGVQLAGRYVGNNIPLEDSFAGAVCAAGKGLVFSSESEKEVKETYPRLLPGYEAGFRSFLGVPLISDGVVFGTLQWQSNLVDSYTEHDLDLAERIGTHISLAITNANLQADLMREVRERKLLSDIGLVIGKSLEMEEVYNYLSQELPRLLKFDLIAISTVDLERNTLRNEFVHSEDMPIYGVGDTRPIEDTLLYDSIKKNQSIRIGSESREVIEKRYPGLKPILDTGIRSALLVPLIFSGSIVGGMFVGSKSRDAYTEHDLELADKVGLQFGGAVANAQLYSERSLAEEEATKALGRLETILDIADDAIISIDRSWTISLFNKGAEKIFGYSPDEVIGEHLEVLLPERFRAEHDAHVRGFASSTKNAIRVGDREGTILGLRKDGEEFRAEASVSRVTYQNEELYIVVLRDITERIGLEHQLVQSQKLEAVGTLAGGIAHDFNNMLSAILSYAHLTKLKVPEHSTASSYLDEIQKAGERSSDLIRQLLTFSRQQVIEPRVLDLNELILGLEKMLRRLIDESIELVMVLDNDPTPVKADPGQLEQILVNMIVNARDAMPDGGSIFVETIAEVAGDETGTRPANINLRECVLIKISDTGVGITDDQKAHIFEPFYTTKDVGKGTGLGLATCYGIVTQSGGSITVDSKPGQGTTFNMFFPKVELDQRPNGQGGLEGSPIGSENVLVVEDEPVVLRLVTHLLKELGYSTFEATNGEEALRFMKNLKGEKVDLLLTDVVMPIMGGKELGERFQRLYPDTKILYMSGYIPDSSFLQNLEQNNLAYLQKPIRLTSLAKKIREALDVSLKP